MWDVCQWYWPYQLLWVWSRAYLPACHSPERLTPPHSHWSGWGFWPVSAPPLSASGSAGRSTQQGWGKNGKSSCSEPNIWIVCVTLTFLLLLVSFRGRGVPSNCATSVGTYGSFIDLYRICMEELIDICHIVPMTDCCGLLLTWWV